MPFLRKEGVLKLPLVLELGVEVPSNDRAIVLKGPNEDQIIIETSGEVRAFGGGHLVPRSGEPATIKGRSITFENLKTGAREILVYEAPKAEH